MIDELTDFQGLDEFIKNSELNYREALIDYYKTLGEGLGFTVRKNSSVIRNGINFGRIDLIWVEPNITFTVEFGNIEEILKHLWKIMEFSPQISVLILSSKSACKPGDAVKIIEKSKLIEGTQDVFLVLDVTEKKVVKQP
ncbi:MAG: hypothetical protein U9Q22_04860 [Candidatus Altiarchaeota archaeon]|nr:hypothetical protein [Candidatus Altiarchaeota archaeon]